MRCIWKYSSRRPRITLHGERDAFILLLEDLSVISHTWDEEASPVLISLHVLVEVEASTPRQSEGVHKHDALRSMKEQTNLPMRQL